MEKELARGGNLCVNRLQLKSVLWHKNKQRMGKKMKTKVKQYNKEKGLFKKGDRIIVGVSGGKDSVCLLHILNELKDEMNLSLMVVHVNHGIRGEAADSDAEFVKEMALSMGLPFRIETVDVREIARIKRISEEEAGRLMRYDTMEILRLRNGYDLVAVAHHQDDVAETVLFNLVRGTGPKGLSGISAKRDAIIRPILFAQSKEIEEYIRENKLAFHEDATNQEIVYTRNKIRLQVFPYLEKEINAKAKAHVAEAARRIALQNQYIEKEAQKAYMKVVVMDGGEYNYTIEEFTRFEPVIQVEVIRLVLSNLINNAKDVEQVHYQMIMDLAQKEVGKRVNLPQGIVVTRTYDTIIFQIERESDRSTEQITTCCNPPFAVETEVDAEQYYLRFQIREEEVNMEEIPQKDYTKWLDYDKIEGDIFLRTPREGDYLTLDEEGRHKKLSRYFIDNKVPAEKRGDELVVADGKHILLIVSSGRISQHYKITENTKRVLVISKERIW